MRGSCDALCGCRDVSRSRSLRSALVIAIAKVARRRCARSIVSVRFASGGESFALRSRSSGCRATRTGRAIGMRDRGRRRIASVGFAAIAIGSRRKRALDRVGSVCVGRRVVCAAESIVGMSRDANGTRDRNARSGAASHRVGRFRRDRDRFATETRARSLRTARARRCARGSAGRLAGQPEKCISDPHPIRRNSL